MAVLRGGFFYGIFQQGEGAMSGQVVETAEAVQRELVALDLVEVSLVAVPMQTLARVHMVESM